MYGVKIKIITMTISPELKQKIHRNVFRIRRGILDDIIQNSSYNLLMGTHLVFLEKGVTKETKKIEKNRRKRKQREGSRPRNIKYFTITSLYHLFVNYKIH